MNMNRLFAVISVGALALLGATVMTINDNKIQQEDNAFAKDCNDRGGVAKFEYRVRQCIGAKRPEATNG
jgi:hypothetical protein